jgi:hypothetical protein
MTKINIYLDEIPKMASYKSKLSQNLYKGLRLFSKNFRIINEPEKAQLIFTINMDFFIQKYEDDFNNNKKKIILISAKDTILDCANIIFSNKDKYVLNYLEFLVSTNIYNSKILCILNMSKYFRNYQNEVKQLKDRFYDVVFIGNLKYDDKQIEKQRIDILEKIKEIGEKNKLSFYSCGSIKLEEYYDILRETKLFISPYGYGEWSLKDYECILFGCQVVKPNIYYKCHPNFYENMEHYNDDINNFEKTILNLLENICVQQKKVDINRQMFLKYNLEEDIKILENEITKNLSI